MKLNLKLLLITLQLALINGADIIVYTTIEASWTSTTFLIPTETTGRSFWPTCSEQSNFYCLSAYETNANNDKPAVATGIISYGVRPIDSHLKYSVFTKSAFQAANKAFQPIYQKHNFFVEEDVGCCVGQYNSYYHYGLQTLKISPELYVSKMTDYSEADKTLNLIWSYYWKDCDINVVSKLGFGKGRLVRNHHKSGLSSHRLGRIFLINGQNLSKFVKIFSQRFLFFPSFSPNSVQFIKKTFFF